MQAVRFAGVGRPAQIIDVPKPSPGPGQIVVKIGGAGVCQDFGLAKSYAGIRTLRLADGPDEVHCRAIALNELAKYGWTGKRAKSEGERGQR